MEAVRTAGNRTIFKTFLRLSGLHASLHARSSFCVIFHSGRRQKSARCEETCRRDNRKNDKSFDAACETSTGPSAEDASPERSRRLLPPFHVGRQKMWSHARRKLFLFNSHPVRAANFGKTLMFSQERRVTVASTASVIACCSEGRRAIMFFCVCYQNSS